MQTSLAATALLMGLVGGPHCVAMCGAACAGIGQAAGLRSNSAMWTFQFGRIIGYSMLGAVAAASIQGMGWLSIQTVALRPVWTLFHVAALILGMMLVWKAQQPVWLESAGRRLWSRARTLAAGWGRGAPLVIGMFWTFLPCGLLYSALLVAAMTGQVLEGAVVMALFALGTSVSMMAGPWLWLRLKGPGSGQWGVRLAGLALAASSFWALWMGLAHNAAPWCVAPAG
jgi:sulfite exporter TauE/SafE